MIAGSTVDFRSQLRRHVTMRVRITGLRGFPVRIWVATRLIWLAAWVVGCGVAVEVGPTKQ